MNKQNRLYGWRDKNELTSLWVNDQGEIVSCSIVGSELLKPWIAPEAENVGFVNKIPNEYLEAVAMGATKISLDR